MLLAGDGVVHAANRALTQRLGRPLEALTGRNLGDFVCDSREKWSDYLRHCGRSRDLIPGKFTFQCGDEGDRVTCRCQGAVIQARSPGSPPLIMLRLLSEKSSLAQFAALNSRIEELNEEVRRRRRVEIALHEQKEWFRVTLGSIGDAVVVTDAHGHIDSINTVAQKLTGYCEAEAIGRPISTLLTLVNEITREPVESPVFSVLKNARVEHLANHTLLVSKDGTEWPIDDSAAPILNERGKLLGAVLVFRDVTESRRASKQLKESADRLGLALDAGRLGWWQWDLITGKVEGNSLCREHLGLPAQAPLSYDLLHGLVHADDRARLRQDVQRGLDERTEFDTEFRILAPDGSVRWVIGRGRALYDDKGVPVYIIGVTLDITERKLAEQKLQESQLLLESSLDALTKHIAVLDERGTILMVNQSWRKPPRSAAFIGHHLRVGANYLAAVRAAADKCDEAQEIANGLEDLLQGKINQFEIEYTCKSRAERLWYELRVKQFSSPGQARLVIAHENITGRKAAEEALKEADRRKDEFLATLAHELRNPLAPIRNGLQLIKLAEHQPDVAAPAIGIMERQVGHMVRLIDDLLDLSRITRGKLALRKERVTLWEIVQSALETSRPLAETKGHEIHVKLPARPIELFADPTRLAQVFSNLLNNSVKYTEPGGQIWFSASEYRGGVAVSVRDTGIGIPPDMLPHIFEMFRQVDASLERAQGGLGIGLTLVKRLVEMHGGHIEARSDGDGTGSRFLVRLPILAAGAAATPLPEQSPPATERSRQRILVVDDNEDAALSMATMLSLSGNDVRAAHDGLQALKTAREFQPDIVLLDIGMPRMNGYDAARRLREEQWGRRALLIALTGWGQEEDKRRSREAGFDAHLVKPVDLAALQHLLASLRPAC